MNTLLKKLFTLTTFSLALLPAQNAVHAQCKNSIDENIYKELPFNMPKVEQPSFPDYTVSILQFGAKSDGTTLNTKAINDAIKAVNAKGGGKVVIPEGLWLTGPIELLSNVNLHTEKNALVVFTDDFNAYPILETSFEGLNTRRCQSPISARNAEIHSDQYTVKREQAEQPFLPHHLYDPQHAHANSQIDGRDAKHRQERRQPIDIPFR